MDRFIRDGRAPIPKDPRTSAIMSRIRAKDTGPELTLRRALSKERIRGYRLHPKTVVGKPDICFIGKKIAVFVHGCYWHRCPHCQLSLPKSHKGFWSEKFKKNVDRDRQKEYVLTHEGWKVLVFWECQIKKNAEKIARQIATTISKREYEKDQGR